MLINKKAVKEELKKETSPDKRVSAEVYDHLEMLVKRELKKIVFQFKYNKTLRPPVV